MAAPLAIPLIAIAASAAGAGLNSYLGAKDSDKKLNYQKYIDRLNLQQQADITKQNREQLTYQNRQSAPGQSLNWLQMIQGLRSGNSKPTGLDVMKLLASSGG